MTKLKLVIGGEYRELVFVRIYRENFQSTRCGLYGVVKHYQVDGIAIPKVVKMFEMKEQMVEMCQKSSVRVRRKKRFENDARLSLTFKVVNTRRISSEFDKILKV